MIPSRTFSFARSLVAAPARIDVNVMQAHLIKHPFGMERLMSGSRRRADQTWDADGWHLLDPPVITLEQRRAMTAAIGALAVGSAQCEVPRLPAERYGGEPPDNWERCYDCPRPLAATCEAETLPVAEAYARVVDETLALVADPGGVVVSAVDFARAVFQLRRDLVGLAVLTVGLARSIDAQPIVRVSRWDGVRVELWLRDGHLMRWRTCYRKLGATRAAQQQFLLEGAVRPTAFSLPLSDRCVVPHLWWRQGGGS